MTFDHQEALNLATDLAGLAGRLSIEMVADATIMTKNDGADFKDSFARKTKGIYSNVDLECQRVIVEGIQKKYPGHLIEAEEGGGVKTPVVGESDYRWVIDPIDGTFYHLLNNPSFLEEEKRRDIRSNFELEDLKKQYAVNIALLRGREFILGVMNFPRLDRLYHSITGQGAYLNGVKITVSDLQTKSCIFSRVIPEDVRERFGAVQISLNSVVSFRKIIHGEALGYLVPNPFFYDIAGGMAILEEAGGYTGNIDGSPVDTMVPRSSKLVVGARDRITYQEICTRYERVS